MKGMKVVVALVLSLSLVLGNVAVASAQENVGLTGQEEQSEPGNTSIEGDENTQTPNNNGQTPIQNEDAENEGQNNEEKSETDGTQTDVTDSEDSSENGSNNDGNEGEPSTDPQPTEEQKPLLSYRVHMQTKGWNNWTDYEYSSQIGSTGQAKRLEAIALKMEDVIEEPEEPETEEPEVGQEQMEENVTVTGTDETETPAEEETPEVSDTPEGDETADGDEPAQEEETGGIRYRVHGQTYGWQNWKADGEIAGTTGQSKRIEAIQIELTGKYAKKYDIYYRVHSQTYGWLDWAKNGEKAGSLGYSKRMEALEIVLVEKDSVAPGETADHYRYPNISYQAHSQTYGWRAESYDNAVAGITGQGKRLEALKIKLPDSEYTGGVSYRAYLQTYGWQNWTSDGQQIGTTGQKKRIEALQIKLTGEMAQHYDIYYSVHLQKIGWTNYAKNGETIGSTGLSKRIEAIRIQLVKNEEAGPNTSGTKYIEGYQTEDLTYAGTVQGQGLSSPVVQGNTLGTTGQKKRLENMVLYLDEATGSQPTGGIQYSVHLQTSGWGSWVDQGTVAGCTDGTKRMEAIKIKLIGDLSKYYDIWYRTHVEKYGWLGWAKNGQAAGTTKCSYRIEAVQIKLVSKDASAPGSNSGYYTEQKYNIGPDAGMYAQVNLYSSSTPYIIAVNRGTRKVGIYQGWRGNWRNIKYWSCTVGAPSSPTVGGVFKVGNRGHYFDSGASRCFWWTQFYGNYLFHSTLYNRNGVPTDSRLGMALSHGCVRLNINNALWIYNNIPRGTTVVVYN